MTFCASPIAWQIYSGRDNPIELVLTADGSPLADLSGVTRVLIDFDGGTTVLDSDTALGAFNWSGQAAYRGQVVDTLTLVLGNQGLPVGNYTDVELVFFDATYPNGLRAENYIAATVHE